MLLLHQNNETHENILNQINELDNNKKLAIYNHKKVIVNNIILFF